MPHRSLTIGTSRTSHCAPVPRLLRPFTDASGATFVSVNIPVSLSSADLLTTPARPWIRSGRPVLDERTGSPILIGPFFEIGSLWIRDSVDEVLIQTPHGPRRATLTFRGSVGIKFLDELSPAAQAASHELDAEDAAINEPAFIPSTASLAPDGRSTIISNTDNKSAFRNPNTEPSAPHSPSRSTRTLALSNTLAASTLPRADAFVAQYNDLTQAIDLRFDRGLITDTEWAAQINGLVARFNASTLPLRTSLQSELASINSRLSQRLPPREAKTLEAKAQELIDEIALLTFTPPPSVEALLASHSSSTPPESAAAPPAPQPQSQGH